MKQLTAIALLATAAAVPTASLAENDFSFYMGFQGAPHSVVTGTDPANGESTDLDFTAAWEGKSWAPPPYYGFRWTHWKTANFGYGVEFSHDKVYASDETRAATGYDRFEFTDGLNIITANVNYRWPGQWMNGDLTPYVGGGLGFAMPHVDVQATAGGPHTFGYQFTGGAMRLFAGASYDINDTWSMFGEYQFTYSMNDAELESGGSFQTNVITNALNIGVTYSY